MSISLTGIQIEFISNFLVLIGRYKEYHTCPGLRTKANSSQMTIHLSLLSTGNQCSIVTAQTPKPSAISNCHHFCKCASVSADHFSHPKPIIMSLRLQISSGQTALYPQLLTSGFK